jgi:hypothetical protein
MEILRRYPIGSVMGIGGHVVLTSVNRDRIETRVVHRWPDVVGEVIAPKL